MAGESAPTPTFKTETTPSKPQLREKIPGIRTLAEKGRQRNEKKAERAARPKYQESTLQSIRQKHEAGTRPIALNLDEDKRFKNMVEAEEAALLQGRGQNITELTGVTALTPSDKAKAKADAYVKYVAAHEDSAKQYAADGFHFAKNKDGTYSIDPKSDIFYITVIQDAQEARLTGGDGAEQAVYDKFAKQYPNKAGIYATHGEQRLIDSLARTATTPDAGVVAKGAPASIDAGKTVSFAEQAEQTKRQLDRMVQLAKEDPSKLKAKDLNELKTLEAQHRQGIDEARRLNTLLRIPGNPALDPQDLAKLEPYEDYIMAQDADKTKAAQQAVATGAPTSVDTTQQIQKEIAIRTLGKEAVVKLQACGIDFATMDEKQVMERLRDGMIKDPLTGNTWDAQNPDTVQYIREAFAEQQKQQAEVVMAKLAPAEVDALEKKHKGDALGLALALLALAIGSFTPEMKATLH